MLFAALSRLSAPLVLLTLLSALAAPTLCAQVLKRPERGPRIENLRFEGVHSVNIRDIRKSIVTEDTHCKGIFAKPFCWLTDWSAFEERNYLDRQELARDELRIRIFYSLRGWREARVISEVIPQGEDVVDVLFRITEGRPTRVANLSIEQEKEVLSSRDLRLSPFPAEGDPLDLVQIDSVRARLTSSLEERGYLDAEIRDSTRLRADPATRDLLITIDPGPRSTLQGFTVEGNEKVKSSVLEDALLLEEGQVLTTRDIVATRRSLYESNLFHEVQVGVAPSPDSAKLLQIVVREAPPRSLRVGGGINTLQFVQLEGTFAHYNFTGRGRRLETRASVGNLLAPQLSGTWPFGDVAPSSPQNISFVDADAFTRPVWDLSVDLQQPSFRSASNTLALGASAHRRSIIGVAIDRGLGVQGSFTHRLDYQSPVSGSYRYESTKVEAGELYFCVNYTICDLPTIETLRNWNRLSPLALSVVHDKSNDPLAPSRGHRGRLDVEHASSFTVSDYRYNRVSGELSYYLPLGLGPRKVLTAHVRGGWSGGLGSTSEALGIGATESPVLHPRKRFYAGGSQSVRGYRENQLGPRILTVDPAALMDPERGGSCTEEEVALATCDPSGVENSAFLPRPLGGKSVIEANLEYRFPLTRNIDGAFFVDGAIVSTGAAGISARGKGDITPGLGVRYLSGIGPIRVDLGIRPRTGEDLPVITEVVTPEGERRIIELSTPRHYDPLQESGGFLKSITERLTLHLSIGQPF